MKTSCIRYVCIIANHEEKSRFMDLLLDTCHEARDVAADTILKDRPGDQLQIGEACKSNCIAVTHMFRSSKYLINIMASPCNMVDGALVIINYENGLCPNIEDGLTKAIKNMTQVTLLINNVDRCFELNGEKVYTHLFSIINQVNDIIRKYGGAEVCPVRGTVGFAFGKHDCAFHSF